MTQVLVRVVVFTTNFTVFVVSIYQVYLDLSHISSDPFQLNLATLRPKRVSLLR